MSKSFSSTGFVINAFFPVAELAIAPNQLEFNLNLVPRTMIRPFHQLLPALAAVSLLSLPSCVSTSLTGATQYLDAGTFSGTPTGAPSNGLPPDTVSFWDGGAGNGPSRIHLKLNEQVADFYRGNVLVEAEPGQDPARQAYEKIIKIKNIPGGCK